MLKVKKLFTAGFILLTLVLIAGCGSGLDNGVDTEIISVLGYDWDYDDPTYSIVVDSDLLTQDIIDNGSVHLYLEAGDGIWMALPYKTMGFAVALNELLIMTEGSGVTSQTTTFKLVTIEGTMTTTGIDYNNYKEVSEYYNLND